MKDLNFTVQRLAFITGRIARIENGITGLKLSMMREAPDFSRICQRSCLSENQIPFPSEPASLILNQAKRMFFPNIKALADFFCCSYTTAKRWKKQLRIPSIQLKMRSCFLSPM